MSFVPTLPVLVSSQSADPVRIRERSFKEAVEACLVDPEVALAIAPFKTNGQVNGHKILDDNAAVSALIDAAPKHYMPALTDAEINPFRKTQLLNGVLAKYWEVDRRTGKLTGNQSASYVKRLTKSQPQTNPENA